MRGARGKGDCLPSVSLTNPAKLRRARAPATQHARKGMLAHTRPRRDGERRSPASPTSRVDMPQWAALESPILVVLGAARRRSTRPAARGKGQRARVCREQARGAMGAGRGCDGGGRVAPSCPELPRVAPSCQERAEAKPGLGTAARVARCIRKRPGKSLTRAWQAPDKSPSRVGEHGPLDARNGDLGAILHDGAAPL